MRAVGTLLLGILMSCDGSALLPATSGLEGVVWLDGAAAGALVELVGPGGVVGHTATDPEGRYVLLGLREEGDVLLRARVDGVELRAEVPGLRLLETRTVALTPFTTLAADVGAAPLEALLGFDPRSAEVGPAGDGEHRLLLEAFDELARRAGDEAGGVVSPGALLQAVLTDAADGLLDGGVEVVAGPASYRLTPQTLQGELAAAVVAVLGAAAWDGVDPADVDPLLRRLRCSGSELFPPCEPAPVDDPTPPGIAPPEPAPETPQAGVATITLEAHDPESGVASLVLRRVGPEGTTVPVRDLDDRPSRLAGVVDTTRLTDLTRLELEAVATNHAGAEAILRFGYPLANVPPGEIAGWVVKGPAEALRIAATGLRADGSEVELAEGYTGPGGSFRLDVPGWRGPVLLRAGGTADHPSGRESRFADEARGEALGWALRHELAALVGSYDPEVPGRPVVVSPLTDLAWHRGLAEAARDGAPLVDAAEEALGLLARHFGLEGVDLLHLRPAGVEEAVALPPGEAARHLLALACLSQQASDLAERRGATGFTALELVAAYREDIGDGQLDGKAGLRAVEVGGAPLGDAFRHGLAVSCGRWLAGAQNRTGMGVQDVVGVLQWMSLDDSALFDPRVLARPFDEEGPTMAIRVEAGAGAAAGARVAGPVEVVVELSDAAGLGEVTADAWVEVLERPGAGATFGTLRGRVDTFALQDGAATLRFRAEDGIGNASEAEVSFVVDNTPPGLQVAPPEAGVGTDGARWTTARDTLAVGVRTFDAGSVELTARFGDEALAVADPVFLRLPEGEGIVPLEVRARDDVGNETVRRFQVARDVTPPGLAPAESTYVDEHPLGLDRDLAAGPRIRLDTAGPVLLRKWQTHWGADDDNPAVLRVEVADPPSNGAGDPEPDLEWRLHRDGAAGPWAPLAGSDLPLTADTLGLDPVGDPPPFGTLVSVELRAVDHAGNATTWRNDYALHVLAPPVRVEVDDHPEAPPGWLTLDDLSLADDSLSRLLLGETEGLLVRRLTITNPHPIPIRVRVEAPETLEITLETTVRFVGRHASELVAEQLDHQLRQFDPPNGGVVGSVEVSATCFLDGLVRADGGAIVSAPFMSNLRYSYRLGGNGEVIATFASGECGRLGTNEGRRGSLAGEGNIEQVLQPLESVSVPSIGQSGARTEPLLDLIGSEDYGVDLQGAFGVWFVPFGEECDLCGLWFGRRLEVIDRADLRIPASSVVLVSSTAAGNDERIVREYPPARTRNVQNPQLVGRTP